MTGEQPPGARGSHLQWPDPLGEGDLVIAVAPAGPPDRALARAGIALLEGWGLRVRVARHAFDGDTSGFLAAPDAARAADLQAALDDEDAGAVVALRGGYGCQRLLGLVDFSRAARRPKAFVGFSDATVLHAALQREAGLVTFHGPSLQWSPARLPGRSATSLWQALSGGAAAELSGAALVPGRAAGPLVGGNLTLLASLCGTRYQPRAEGCVLLLEDVAERPYRLDRAMTQLGQAGVLDGVAGLAFGTFHRCEETRSGRRCASAREVLAAHARRLGVPAVWDLPLGHGPGQMTVALGSPAILDGDAGLLHPAARPTIGRP